MKGIWRDSSVHWIRSWKRQRTGKSQHGMDGRVGVLSYRARQLVADVWVSCLASCCKGGPESCCIFTGPKPCKNQINLCFSASRIHFHLLPYCRNVSAIEMGGQVTSDQSKRLMGCPGHSTCNSRAPLGALCVPGSGLSRH